MPNFVEFFFLFFIINPGGETSAADPLPVDSFYEITNTIYSIPDPRIHLHWPANMGKVHACDWGV